METRERQRDRREEKRLRDERRERYENNRVGDHASPSVRPTSSIFSWSPHTLPVRLSLGEIEGEVVQVAASGTHSLATTNLGNIAHWHNLHTGNNTHSDDDESSVGGDSEETSVAVMVKCPSSVTVVEVACGDGFMACVTDRGILLTKGKGITGSLGHGDTQDCGHLRMVESLLGVSVVGVACGRQHILARTLDGAGFGWGCGEDGRLGVGSRINRLQPQAIELPGSSDGDDGWCVVNVVAGDNASFITTSSGILLATGSNSDNKLCLDETDTDGCETLKCVEGVTTFIPVCSRPLADSHINHVSLGPTHSLFITECGEVWSSGSNRYNQLGRPPPAPLDPRVPTRVFLEGLSAKSVVCGATFSMAVTQDGALYRWGGEEVTPSSDNSSKSYTRDPSHPCQPHLSAPHTSDSKEYHHHPEIVKLNHKLSGKVSLAAAGDFVLVSHRV